MSSNKATFRSRTPFSIRLGFALVLVFLWQCGSSTFEESFSLSRDNLAAGRWWCVLTYSLLHGDFMHLTGNLIGLTFVMATEDMVGSWRTAMYYTLGCLAAGLTHLTLFDDGGSMVGASGGIFTCATLYILHQPRAKLLVLFVPMRAALGGLLLLGFSVVGLFFYGNISHIGHLAGMAVGLAAFFAIPINKVMLPYFPPETTGSVPSPIAKGRPVRKLRFNLCVCWLMQAIALDVLGTLIESSHTTIPWIFKLWCSGFILLGIILAFDSLLRLPLRVFFLFGLMYTVVGPQLKVLEEPFNMVIIGWATLILIRAARIIVNPSNPFNQEGGLNPAEH